MNRATPDSPAPTRAPGIPLPGLARRSGRPGLRQAVKQIDHFQRRQRAFAPFVAYVAAGAMDRLFEGIAGQHSEQDRNPRAEAGLGQSDAHSSIDVLVV